MKKSLLFITRPIQWIRYDDVEHVEFVTEHMRGRSFELHFVKKDGSKVVFTMLERITLSCLYDFFCKKISLKIRKGPELERRGCGG